MINKGFTWLMLTSFFVGFIASHFLWIRTEIEIEPLPVLGNGVVKDCLVRNGSFYAVNDLGSNIGFHSKCVFQAKEEDEILQSL